MNLKAMIQIAAREFENQRDLADALGVHPNVLTSAKRGARGLPAFACFRLAEILAIDPVEVIAVSELITEKDEEKRQVFIPFLRHAAGIMGVVVLSNFTAPSPAEAAPLRPIFNYASGMLYIM